MCGIVGTLDLRGGFGDGATVLGHRGSDVSGASGPVRFGYVRLSIVDLSEADNQPITDKTANWVGVYNGEIYNFLEPRSELERRGVRFCSPTDTEVLLNLFAREGVSAGRTMWMTRLNVSWEHYV